MCTERKSLIKECGWKDATEAAWLPMAKNSGKKKVKVALTSTGLLMEGVEAGNRATRLLKVVYVGI